MVRILDTKQLLTIGSALNGLTRNKKVQDIIMLSCGNLENINLQTPQEYLKLLN